MFQVIISPLAHPCYPTQEASIVILCEEYVTPSLAWGGVAYIPTGSHLYCITEYNNWIIEYKNEKLQNVENNKKNIRITE